MTLNEAAPNRVDEIAIRALGLNGPYAGQPKVWDALEIVTTAIETDGAWRSFLRAGDAEGMEALKIVKQRLLALVREDEDWFGWWEENQNRAEVEL